MSKFYLLPIVSGCLIALSYIPFWPWALFFSFAPLWHFCLKNRLKIKKLLLAGWICQFTFTLIGFHWVAYTLHVFGNMPKPLSVLGLILFSATAHLHIPLALAVWSWITRFQPFQKEWVQKFLLAWLTAVSFSLLPQLFPWHLGYSWFWGQFPAFHTAEIWGFQFLNTLTLFLQLCFLSKKKSLKIFIPLGVFIFLIVNAFGVFIEKQLKTPDQQAHVLMVQHNISSLRDARTARFQSHRTIRKKLFRLTQKELKKNKNVDFILWSEGAYPYFLFENTPDLKTRLLQDKVKNHFKTPLVTGGMGERQKGVTNSIFFLNRRGQLKPQRYDKNYLLAFGEFIPGDRWFPWLRKYFLGGDRPFIAGKSGPVVRAIEDLNIGLQICYEGLFESFSRTLALNQADIFVNVTNDSWFGSTFEPYQHLYMSLARGIENRKPVIRLTNTGLSAVMTAKGEIIAQSPLKKTWTQAVSVPYSAHSKPTVFARWGFRINGIFLLLALIWPLIFWLSRRK